MNNVIPNVSSVITRSTHILLIRIDEAILGTWIPAPNGGVWRTVRITITLQEVLKGVTEEQPGSRIQTEITQWGTGTTRKAGVPGSWSHQTLDPGVRLIAFCQAASNHVAEMLKDPFCQLLLPADQALTDVMLSLKTKSKNISFGLTIPEENGLFGALAEAQPLATSLGHVWADHLWATYAPEILASPKNFKALMQILELPDISYVARATLLNNVYSQIIATPVVLSQYVQPLAITMFRLLDISQAYALHDNIISVFLPNLIGLTGGIPKKSPGDIFKDCPEERMRIEKVLLGYKGNASTVSLLQWIRS